MASDCKTQMLYDMAMRYKKEAEEETDEEEVQEGEETKKEETPEKFLDVCKKEDEKKGKK